MIPFPFAWTKVQTSMSRAPARCHIFKDKLGGKGGSKRESDMPKIT